MTLALFVGNLFWPCNVLANQYETDWTFYLKTYDGFRWCLSEHYRTPLLS